MYRELQNQLAAAVLSKGYCKFTEADSLPRAGLPPCSPQKCLSLLSSLLSKAIANHYWKRCLLSLDKSSYSTKYVLL